MTLVKVSSVPADPLKKLIQEFHKLPGIGLKTATRLAFHAMKMPLEQVQEFCQALIDVKNTIRLCSICANFTKENPCELCQNHKRLERQICVVAQPSDVISIERAGTYQGKYHVLQGLLSPLDGIGPDKLHIRELLERCQNLESQLEEVILALSPTIEGEATSMYLYKLLKPLDIKVTRIASGLPIGGELEYADSVTINRAFEIRRELS